jgi:hypothetical protein
VFAWGTRASQEARARVVGIARGGGFDPNWLSAAIMFESRWDPKAVNPLSRATGLIQFMPRTAEGLGTTVEQLAAMSAEAQLNFVAAYFAPFAHRISTIEDCYMAILWPAAVGKPNDAPLFSKDDANAKAYFANKGLDVNQDGVVTKAEAAARVVQLLAQGLLPANATTDEAEVQPVAAQEAPMGALIPILTTLLPTVLGLFQPKIQAKVEQVTGQPPEVAGPFLIDFFSKMAQLAGVVQPGQAITTPTQAVQAAAALQTAPATAVQELEQHTLDYLDKIGPTLDRLAQLDREEWAAAISGRDAASARAARDRVDLGPFLARVAAGIAALIILCGLVALGLQVWLNDDHEPSVGLVGLLGPIITLAVKWLSDIIAYRFDGTPTSNAANAANAAIAASLPTKG